jgi:inner membrane protein
MGLLTFLLLIPLMMVQGVVSERATRRVAAVQEVSTTWGAPQTVGGIVLSVPFTHTSLHAGRTTGQARFLPRDLQVAAVLNTEARHRGIFDVSVYRATLVIKGRFVRPDLDWIKPLPDEVYWDQATVSLGISDPRGLTRRTTMDWNGRQVAFTGGGADAGLFKTGMRADVAGLGAMPPGADVPFALTIELNGSHDIRFLPAAEETT